MKKIIITLILCLTVATTYTIVVATPIEISHEDKHTITYHVLPDEEYGYPNDSYVPEPQTNVKPKTLIYLRDVPTSEQKYAVSNITGETKRGRWIMLTGWHSNTIEGLQTVAFRNLTKDTDVYGRWLFQLPECYDIDYIINPDPTYGLPEDILPMNPIKNVPYGYTAFLDFVPNTEITYAYDENGNKIEGKWVRPSDTWYINPDNTLRVYYFENIHSDKTVYSSWKFYPHSTTFTITYHVLANARYGVPDINHVPNPDKNIPYNTNPKLLNPVLEFMTNQLYAIDRLTGEEVKGIWQISPFWHDGSITGKEIQMYWGIDDNHDVYAQWYFFPSKYDYIADS